MSNSAAIKVIDNVVLQAQERYKEYIKSKYIAVNLKIDGKKTRGQCKDNTKSRTIKEENTKMMTCMLDCPVHRGSLVEMQANREDKDYSVIGIVISVPNQTPVDYYYQTLFFNTRVDRYRRETVYDDDGDVVSDKPIIVKDIPCFVERIGMRERQIDAGIDRNSVNELITTKDVDLDIDDVLFIGNDHYIITDIEELDRDILTAYMTYYREDVIRDTSVP